MMASLVEIRLLLASRIGRIGAGLTALSTLTVFLWPDKGWSFDIEKFILFIIALLAWLWSEVDGAGEPHPSDIALFGKLVNTISHTERRTMIEHNMGDSFPMRAFDGSSEIVETWKGAAFEFQDRELDRQWSEVRKSLEDFMLKIITYTGSHPYQPGLATVKTDDDFARGHRSSLTLERAKELNDAASLSAKRLDDFERLAKKKLRI